MEARWIGERCQVSTHSPENPKHALEPEGDE